jgi:hypothetical protein
MNEAIWVIIAVNLLLIGILALRCLKGGATRDPAGLEAFCANLPRDARIRDPYVIIDGKWICQDD